jgi:hypothetical protein
VPEVLTAEFCGLADNLNSDLQLEMKRERSKQKITKPPARQSRHDGGAKTEIFFCRELETLCYLRFVLLKEKREAGTARSVRSRLSGRAGHLRWFSLLFGHGAGAA